MIKRVSLVELLGNEGKKMPVLVRLSFRNLAHKGASFVSEKDAREEARRNYTRKEATCVGLLKHALSLVRLDEGEKESYFLF